MYYFFSILRLSVVVAQHCGLFLFEPTWGWRQKLSWNDFPNPLESQTVQTRQPTEVHSFDPRHRLIVQNNNSEHPVEPSLTNPPTYESCIANETQELNNVTS